MKFIGLTFKNEILMKSDLFVKVYECEKCLFRKRCKNESEVWCDRCKKREVQTYHDDEFKVGML